MSNLSKSEKDELREVIGRVIARRAAEIADSPEYMSAVEDAQEGLEESLLGEDVVEQVEKVIKAEEAKRKAETRLSNAEGKLRTTLTNRLSAAEEDEEDVLNILWVDANGKNRYGNYFLNLNVDGVRKVVKKKAKEVVAKYEEFSIVGQLNALRENLDMIILNAKSKPHLNQMIAGFYEEFATEEDKLASEIMKKLFPFLYLDKKE